MRVRRGPRDQNSRRPVADGSLESKELLDPASADKRLEAPGRGRRGADGVVDRVDKRFRCPVVCILRPAYASAG